MMACNLFLNLLVVAMRLLQKSWHWCSFMQHQIKVIHLLSRTHQSVQNDSLEETKTNGIDYGYSDRADDTESDICSEDVELHSANDSDANTWNASPKKCPARKVEEQMKKQKVENSSMLCIPKQIV